MPTPTSLQTDIRSERDGHEPSVAITGSQLQSQLCTPEVGKTSGSHAPHIDGPFEDRLAEITRLDQATLRAGWTELFGRPPPKGMSRRLLQYALAYDAQAGTYGGLRPATRRKLLQSIGQQPNSQKMAPKRKLRGIPPPGSRLVREWHGRSHSVEVLNDGFRHAGRQYRSLSEVARAITGARWSGPRFFGL
jgi:hypothetical protein